MARIYNTGQQGGILKGVLVLIAGKTRSPLKIYSSRSELREIVHDYANELDKARASLVVKAVELYFAWLGKKKDKLAFQQVKQLRGDK